MFFVPVFRSMINVFLCITQLGFCCVYFVFISQSIEMVSVEAFNTCIERIYSYSTVRNFLFKTGAIFIIFHLVKWLPTVLTFVYLLFFV